MDMTLAQRICGSLAIGIIIGLLAYVIPRIEVEMYTLVEKKEYRNLTERIQALLYSSKEWMEDFWHKWITTISLAIISVALLILLNLDSPEVIVTLVFSSLVGVLGGMFANSKKLEI